MNCFQDYELFGAVEGKEEVEGQDIDEFRTN
jgi:hypothetical protein